MDRRVFAWSLLAGLACPDGRTLAQPAPGIDALTRIMALKITHGPLRGAYRMTTGGDINWYFSNLGLLALVPHLDRDGLDRHVRPYLDLYLSRLQADQTIADVRLDDDSLQSFSLMTPDSDDSYAATFISLTTLYLRATDDRDWWRTHSAHLQSMVHANIASQIKPNGLCRAMQPARASAYAGHGFTMNNCEDYRSLRDLSDLLEQHGQPSAAGHWRMQARQLGQAIQRVLWDPLKGGYRTSDQASHADTCSFYPGACCQVFAQIYGVREAASRHDAAYRFLNTHWPAWSHQNSDAFPWCILGYAAARRGDRQRAREHLALTDALDRIHPEQMTIHELGFYRRTQHLLMDRLRAGNQPRTSP